MSDNVRGVKVGDGASLEKTIADADVAGFANVTGDNQPLHLDNDFAASTRFKKRVAHGMLSAGLISAALGTRLAPDSTVVYLSQSLRFLRPVFIGDTVTATLEVISIDTERSFVTCSTACTNQHGETVLTGEATVLLDPKP